MAIKTKITRDSVLILSYGLSKNVGDNAILEGTLETLKKEGVTTVFIPNFGKDKKITTPSHLCLVDFNPTNPWKIFQSIQKSEYGLLGGGGIIQTNTSMLNLIYFLGLSALLLLLRKPLRAFRLGVHEIEPNIARLAVKIIMNRCTSVSVRDKHSRDRLIKYGVKKNIEVMPDPAFERTHQEDNVSDYIKKIPLASQYVLFSLRPPRPKNNISFKTASRRNSDAKLKKDARAFFENTSKLFEEVEKCGRGRWLFIANHYPRDLKFTTEVLRLLKKEGAYTIARPVNFDEIEFLSKNASLVISARLHTCIAATKTKSNLIAVENDKIRDVLVAGRNNGETETSSVRFFSATTPQSRRVPPQA